MSLINYPQLLKEWDYEKNTIKPEEVTGGSHKKVWWKCSNNHSWQTYIYTRTRQNTGCPYCSGRCATKINNLLVKYPQLLKEWDFEKNDIKPDEVTSKSNKKVWWKCSKGHSWCATISHRTSNNNNCPYCSNNKVLKSFNDLQTLYPFLISEWDYKKNIIKPDEIASKSRKKVWWKCNQGHSWNAIIANRTKNNANCPYCSGFKTLKGYNDLQTYCLNNDKGYLLKEWDYEKNNLINTKPDSVTVKSAKKVWWKCSKGHSWEAHVYHRTNGEDCPICNNNLRTSFGEQSIYYYLKNEAVNRYKYLGKEIDIYLPKENIGIEFNGLYWHKDKDDKDKEKELFFINNGIKMFYICESDKNEIINNKIYFDSKQQYNNNLEWSIKELFKLLKPLNFNIDVNISRDKELINRQYKF